MLFTSCWEREERIQIPHGVWQSENPHIILYIDPFYQHFASVAYLGYFIEGGEKIKVSFQRGLVGVPNDFKIQHIDRIYENGNIVRGETLFEGHMSLVNNQLWFRVYQYGQQTTIIFNQMEYYES